ncbi:MAG TPA: glutamate 5-kinase [Polyangiaceae bacterium]
MAVRPDLTKTRRLVVKIGSRTIAGDAEFPSKLAGQVAALAAQKCSSVVVTSGAIALGFRRLGYRAKPKEVGLLQASAAAGQSVLMRRYDEAFGALGLTPAQVLLSYADLADRERLNNAREALAALLDANAVPIVNENDTVATDEIRFGDNDQLAAMVVPLVGADLLVLLTDVDGVLDASGKRIPVMAADAEMIELGAKADRIGSGGMASKVDAARKACRSGASVVIAPADRPNVLADIVAGADVGTLFPRLGLPLKARKHWIAFTLRPKGALILDAGAVLAMREGKSSLLPIGVLGVSGEFNAGDAVRLIGADGVEIARGLTRLGTVDVARAARKKGAELEAAFGEDAAELVVVHKDDLVVSG